jgi:hypothetical protein
MWLLVGSANRGSVLGGPWLYYSRGHVTQPMWVAHVLCQLWGSMLGSQLWGGVRRPSCQSCDAAHVDSTWVAHVLPCGAIPYFSQCPPSEPGPSCVLTAGLGSFVWAIDVIRCRRGGCLLLDPGVEGACQTRLLRLNACMTGWDGCGEGMMVLMVSFYRVRDECCASTKRLV